MQFKRCPIDGLLIIEPKIWPDNRGYFTETYNQALFAQHGIPDVFVQDNMSYSQKGVLRGLHAQIGANPQGKLVRVVQGKAWDVAVDIRPDSVTYGQYFALELSSENQLSLWIPPGFLHGFLALVDHTILTYKVTAPYDPNSEIGVRWDDAEIDIMWPLATLDSEPLVQPILSNKDKILPSLNKINQA